MGETNEKIFLIPAIKNLATSELDRKLTDIFKTFAKILKRRRAIKESEVCEFEEFYELQIADLYGQQQALLRQYYAEKTELWEKVNRLNQGLDLEVSRMVDVSIAEPPKQASPKAQMSPAQESMQEKQMVLESAPELKEGQPRPDQNQGGEPVEGELLEQYGEEMGEEERLEAERGEEGQ